MVAHAAGHARRRRQVTTHVRFRWWGPSAFPSDHECTKRRNARDLASRSTGPVDAVRLRLPRTAPWRRLRARKACTRWRSSGPSALRCLKRARAPRQPWLAAPHARRCRSRRVRPRGTAPVPKREARHPDARCAAHVPSRRAAAPRRRRARRRGGRRRPRRRDPGHHSAVLQVARRAVCGCEVRARAPPPRAPPAPRARHPADGPDARRALDHPQRRARREVQALRARPW